MVKESVGDVAKDHGPVLADTLESLQADQSITSPEVHERRATQWFRISQDAVADAREPLKRDVALARVAGVSPLEQPARPTIRSRLTQQSIARRSRSPPQQSVGWILRIRGAHQQGQHESETGRLKTREQAPEDVGTPSAKRPGQAGME